MALLAGATVAVFGLPPRPASAVIVHLPTGKTLSYQPLRGAQRARPLDQAFSNLDYNGGPVMASNTNYAIYWDPSGGSAYPAGYLTGLNQYFTDLAHDSGQATNVDSVATQYNDFSGHFAAYSSQFGDSPTGPEKGSQIDTDPYPANGCTYALTCLTDAQIQTELSSYVTAHGLPRGRGHEYFLLTPPGVQSCFDAIRTDGCSAGTPGTAGPGGDYCAYHGNTTPGPNEIIYANDPYVTGNNGCDDGNHPNGTSDGALEGGLSHEHNESITDPEPNSAWADFGSANASGEEIGDKCGGSTGAPLGTHNGANYNQIIDGHFYWYQEEWSNQGHICKQRLAFSGAEPGAQFTATPGPGSSLSVAFDATGSAAPGGVSHYNWQFNDAISPPGPSTPDETTGPTDNHTFPSAGQYTVALTVFAADGTSIGTSVSVTVGQGAGPVPSPAVGNTAGSPGPNPGPGPSAGAAAAATVGSTGTAPSPATTGASPGPVVALPPVHRRAARPLTPAARCRLRYRGRRNHRKLVACLAAASKHKKATRRPARRG